MKPIQVYLDEVVIKNLKQRALDEGTTVSDIVRDLLNPNPAMSIGSRLVESEMPEDVQKAIKVINSPEEAKAIAEDIVSNPSFRAFMGEKTTFCKNGHPMNKYGDRCLGKGCKYS